MAEFKTFARTSEIPEGKAKTVNLGTRTVAIFHHQGQFYAIDDMCMHMGASLAAGDVENCVVTCPWHGWQFNIQDGTWVNSPRLKTNAYKVRVQGDEVQLEV
jgi:nitrite reductase (NADH) small subunit